MNQPTEDEELERYLERQHPLSDAYAALGREVPSFELDRAVLQRARTAVHEAQKQARPRRNWFRTAALAATVVLCVAVVLQLDRAGLLVPQAARMPAPQAEGKEEKEEVSEPYSVELLPPSQSAPAPASVPNESPATVGGGTDAARRTHEAFSPTPPPASVAPSPPLAEQAAPAREERASTGDPELPRDGAPAEQDETSSSGQDSAFLGAVRKSMRTPEPEARVPNAPAQEGAAAVAPHAAAPAKAAPGYPDPEEWLKEIEQLRAQGRNREADESMQRFLEIYPDYLQTRSTPPTE